MESPLYRRRDPLPPKAMVGMVHLHALPGTPKCSKTIDQIVAVAVQEAVLLEECGFDAIILENMHDTPYLNREVGPEIVASMVWWSNFALPYSEIGGCLHRCSPGSQNSHRHPGVGWCQQGSSCCGIGWGSVLRPLRGLRVLACRRRGLHNSQPRAVFFNRVAPLYTHISVRPFAALTAPAQGIMNSDAGELLRYRRAINADHIAVFCDIKKKHSAHAITSDVTIGQTAEVRAWCWCCSLGCFRSCVGAVVRLVRIPLLCVPPSPLPLGIFICRYCLSHARSGACPHSGLQAHLHSTHAVTKQAHHTHNANR